MDATSFKELLNRYYAKTCSQQEIALLARLVKQPEYDAILKEWLADIDLEQGDQLVLPEATASSMLHAIFTADPAPVALPVHKIHFLKTQWFRYAAILLLVAGTAILLYLDKPRQNTIVTKQPDIRPGGNRAILTLANGNTIVLDAASVGTLASEGTTRIMKPDAGQVVYQAGGNPDTESLTNTISTPKGGQYQVVLPDGTRVWLNAASSITFPTAFRKERKVTITGEAYLEVAKNTEKPFIVDARGTLVKVLGTGFNINAYPDEASVKTILAEGSVQVVKDNRALILKPGQQCLAVGGQPLVAYDADMEQGLAWKNGTFFFRRTNIADAMRQLSRWYDVEIIYEKGIPDIKLGGEMQRDLNLSEVLATLKELGVDFRIDKKQLTIINNSHGK